MGKEPLRKSQCSEKRKERLCFGALLFRDHPPPTPQAFGFSKNPLLCEEASGDSIGSFKVLFEKHQSLKGKIKYLHLQVPQAWIFKVSTVTSPLSKGQPLKQLELPACRGDFHFPPAAGSQFLWGWLFEMVISGSGYSLSLGPIFGLQNSLSHLPCSTLPLHGIKPELKASVSCLKK